MNSKLLAIIKYIFLLAIAFALLYFAFRGVRVENIFHQILHANLFWISLSSVLSIIALISRAYRWNLLIESAGYSPPLKKTFYSLMIGYFANLAFPRLGEVTRCGSLSKAESIPFSSLLGTVIVERVIDVISLLFCLLLTAILEYKRLGNFLNDNIMHPLLEKFRQLMGSPVLIIIVILFIAGLSFTIFYLLKRAKQKGKKSKPAQLISGLIDGLRSVAKLKKPWQFIFHSIFIWVLYFLAVYVCLFALPSTSHLGLSTALFLLVAGGLGMSAPVQGGIGAYHLLVSQGLMLYGLSRQDGLTFATLVHTLQLVFVVLFGVISLLLMFSGNKKNTIKQEVISQKGENS